MKMNYRLFNMATITITVILLLGFYMVYSNNPKMIGFFSATTSVGIIDQVEAAFYEEEREDVIFEISIKSDGDWYSYNGSYGGIKGGFDSFDNITQTFTLENMGSTHVDILISSEDFGINEGNYIEVSMDDGDFQIYVPGVGWKNIPDNNDNDIDGKKDDEELCIANLLLVGNNLTGFDFRIRNGLSGNYSFPVEFTAYNGETSNPCKIRGEYVEVD